MAERPCRCLLAQAGQKDMARIVAEYVSGLDEALRTPEDAYRTRLGICEGCDQLLSGTCRLCGCYVEARAAKRNQACPQVPAKWEKYPE